MADTESQEMLISLEEEVKCPLCLDIFTKPKMLPCQHVFCEQCLQATIARGAVESLQCPVCLRDTPLQGSGADQFPTAIQANRFKDKYQKKNASINSLNPACYFHPSQPIVLYCETCSKLVCRDCVLTSCSKKGHVYDFLEVMAKKYRTELREKMKPIQDLHGRIATALEAVKSDNTKMKKKKDVDIQEVNDKFASLLHTLEMERTYFISAIEERFQQQSSKEENLEAAADEVTGILQCIENESQKYEEAVPELSSKYNQIEGLLRKHSDLHLCSESPPDLKMELVSTKDLKEFLQERNYILEAGNYFNGNIMFEQMEVNKEFNADFIIPHCHKSFDVTSVLICCRDNSAQRVTVTREADKFHLQVVPRKRGRHSLHVLHKEVHLYGSPVTTFVSMDPCKVSDVVIPLKAPLSNCVALKCFDNHVYINEAKKAIVRVEMVQNSSKKIQSQHRIPATGLVEFTMHENLIFMTTTKDYVIKMDMNGFTLSSAGGRGSLPGLFHFANSLKVSKCNEVHVCDTKNNRIQVFDTNLNFLRAIGKKGNGPGEFNTPDDLDFDEDGNLYVTEEQNHRIQVLTPQGAHIRFIGELGHGLGNLQYPISLVIYRRLIYVTDAYNSRISVFGIDGHHVTSFSEGLSLPEGIAIDEDGFIYVSNDRSALVRF